MCLTLCRLIHFFFFNDTATTEIYTLSLHDALPIFNRRRSRPSNLPTPLGTASCMAANAIPGRHRSRSEEHTSELQSRRDLVCRLLLEKKKKDTSHKKRFHGRHQTSARRNVYCSYAL